MSPADALLLTRVRTEHARAAVHPLRACELCDHGGCTHQCHYTGRPVPAAVARSAEGHCGPDARHQRIKGDDLQMLPPSPWRPHHGPRQAHAPA